MTPQLTAFLALIRRYPFAAAALVLLLGCGGGAYFLWDDIDTQEAARIDRAKEGEAMLELLVGGSTQRQELAAVREATRRIEDNLIIEANLADNNWYFYKFEDQTKVRILELHPQTSPTTDGAALYKRVPYTLRVTGTYEQVAAYLLALETGPRLANITSFGLSRRDQESGALVLDLGLELLGKK
jgi:hypothetical protein